MSTDLEALVGELRRIAQECGQTNGRPINGGDLEFVDDAADALESLSRVDRGEGGGSSRDHEPAIGSALEWRDISTAPRDGTDLLLICASAYAPTACIGWWGWWNNSEGWQHYSRPEEKWHGGVTRWFPTHWTHVPTLDADPSSAKQVDVPKSRDEHLTPTHPSNPSQQGGG